MSKPFTFLLVALVASLSTPAQAEQTAALRLVSMSLPFERGLAPSGAALELTTIAPVINGELQPSHEPPDYPHKSDFYLSNSLGAGLVSGSLTLILPWSGDRDTNHVYDFFEVSGTVATNTGGAFTSSAGDGLLTATWFRASGSITGNCSLTFTFDASGQTETFDCPFTLNAYTGSLDYQLGSNGVPSVASLTQTGQATNTLAGSMFFTRVTDGFIYEITFAAGAFTNAAGQGLPFPATPLTRLIFDPRAWSPTIYYNVFSSSDGNPQTAAPDFSDWMITIDDTHDADGDGVTDLADQFFAEPPRPPTLAFGNVGTNVFLQLSGDIGRVHEIQEADSLPATNWHAMTSFILANDPQLLTSPSFSEPAKYLRAVAR